MNASFDIVQCKLKFELIKYIKYYINMICFMVLTNDHS
jgi:hypothetical protein